MLCDEVFGRQHFVATCVWEKDKGGRGDADISLSHDNVLVYAKDRAIWANARNLLPRTETQLGRFKNPDNDPRGPWRQGDDGTAKSGTEKQRFEVTLPSGRVVKPPPGRYWAFSPQSLELARKEGRAYFGTDGDRLPIIKRYLSEVRDDEAAAGLRHDDAADEGAEELVGRVELPLGIGAVPRERIEIAGGDGGGGGVDVEVFVGPLEVLDLNLRAAPAAGGSAPVSQLRVGAAVAGDAVEGGVDF